MRNLGRISSRFCTFDVSIIRLSPCKCAQLSLALFLFPAPRLVTSFTVRDFLRHQKSDNHQMPSREQIPVFCCMLPRDPVQEPQEAIYLADVPESVPGNSLRKIPGTPETFLEFPKLLSCSDGYCTYAIYGFDISKSGAADQIDRSPRKTVRTVVKLLIRCAHFQVLRTKRPTANSSGRGKMRAKMPRFFFVRVWAILLHERYPALPLSSQTEATRCGNLHDSTYRIRDSRQFRCENNSQNAVYAFKAEKQAVAFRKS